MTTYYFPFYVAKCFKKIAADSIIKIKNLMHLMLALSFFFFFSLQMNYDYLSLFLHSHINGTAWSFEINYRTNRLQNVTVQFLN